MMMNMELSLLSQLDFPVFLIQKDTFRYLFANEAAQKFYGLSEKEFLNLTQLDLAITEDRPSANTFLKSLAFSSKKVNTRICRHKTATSKGQFVKSTFKNVSYNDTEYYLCTVQDISMTMQWRKKYDSLYNAVTQSSMVLIFDENGIISDVSDLYRTVSGFEVNELIGKHIDRLHLDSTMQWPSVKQNILEYGAYTSVFCRRKSPSNSFWSLDYIHQLDNGNGTNSYIMMGTDISEIINIESYKNKLLAILSDYSQLASHQIRGPISTVMALNELFKNNLITKKEYLPQISAKLDEIDQIIKRYSAKIELLESPRESILAAID